MQIHTILTLFHWLIFLDYEASFFGDDSTTNSGVLEDSICFSDNSTSPHNCTVATVSSLTEVTLDWSFVPNIRNGESQVEVYVDGKKISKFISTLKLQPLILTLLNKLTGWEFIERYALL